MTDILYRDELLEHYREPRNFGKPKKYTKASRQLNPFCGDEIEMFVLWEKEKVKDISFLGKGCVVSTAAASLLTDYSLGKTKTELTKFSENDMLSLLGIEVSEIRKKCAFLAISVLKDCVIEARI